MKIRNRFWILALAVAASCATLRNVVLAPRFSVASGRSAELRLVAPTLQNPLGGAAIRIWARVENPNPIGFTLAGLTGSLFLEDTRAATVDFPLGVPLLAARDTVIPLDILLHWSDLPGLKDVATRLITRSSVGYRLDGTVRVDAGALGEPSFGPSTLLTGQLAVHR